MHIVALTPDYFDEFYELVEEMVAQSEFKDAKPNKEKIRQLTRFSHVCFYLAVHHDEVVGFVGGVAQEYFFSDRLRISDLGLYVKPSHRGSLAAKLLIQSLENWARFNKISDLYIGQMTALNVDRTMKFYAHQGYSMVGYNTVKHLGVH